MFFKKKVLIFQEETFKAQETKEIQSQKSSPHNPG